MLTLTVKLKPSDFENKILLNIKLVFLGYSLIESNVYLNKPDDVGSEWSTSIDLIRWYYKTSRK